jgi:very-short-patch-repair endonuclease
LPGGEEVVELTTPRWLRARRRGVIVHESTRLHDSDLREIDGIPVMRPERVVFELAGLWPSPRYVERVVQAARRQRLITFESMSEEFARYARRGVRGVAAVRTVLEEWDPRARPTESEMETKLLRILRDAGFPDAVPQFEISDPRGRFVARVDLALPAARIAIEYDSKQEHSDEFQLARDAHRRNRITAAGWRVFSARHRDVVTGCAELLATIAAVRASA